MRTNRDRNVNVSQNPVYLDAYRVKEDEMTKSFFLSFTSSCLCMFLVVSLAGCGGEAKVTVRDKGSMSASAGGGAVVPDNAPAEPMSDDKAMEKPMADDAMDKSSDGEAMMADMGGMKNGLFPQMGGGEAMASRFGGGLFPAMPGGTPVATEPNSGGGGNAFVLDGGGGAEPEMAKEMAKEEMSKEMSKDAMMAKTGLYDKAVQAFARHEEEDAMNLLYAHVLVADD